jgi:putative FmdB family regulatory protein
LHSCDKDLVMPTYEYKCTLCSRLEDVIHGVNEKYSGFCSCGGKMNKIFSKVGVSFKGSGFYSTDNREK